jgi:hypothetical protein
MDISTATNNELDRLAVENDEAKGDVVLRKVYEFTGRFIVYPSEAAHVAHTLWCVHAHLMDAWYSTPRLAFLSPEPGSGKSRALEITELLVPNPVTAVNVTPSYLFRKVGQDGGATILYDEIDTVFGPRAKENEEIRGLLNAGHKRGAVAGRCAVRGKEVFTEELPAYSAVALAGLGWLPDTIMSRSVVVRMRKRRQGEDVKPYRDRQHAPEGHQLRSQIETWAKYIADDVTPREGWPVLPESIVDRAADVWEPLIAIADMAGGQWPARARSAALGLMESGEDREPSLGVTLLQDCKTAFGSAVEMPSSLLISALVAMPEAPWGDLKGKPLDPRGLSARLREYGIKPKTIRIGDATPRGYCRSDFIDAWDRYLPSSEEAKTPATSAAAPPTNEEPQDRWELSTGDNSRRHKCAHCGERGETLEVHYGYGPHWLHRECIDAWRVDYDDRHNIAGMGKIA